MINALRTLMMNRPASELDGSDFSEYVDPSFRPVVASAEIERMRSLLLGVGPFKDAINMAGSALCRLAHRPEFEKYALRTDPRVTYDIKSSKIADALAATLSSYHLEMAGALARLDAAPRHLLFPCPFTTAEESADLAGRASKDSPGLDRLSAYIIAVHLKLEEARLG